MLRVMVAMSLTIYRNLFEILRSINIVESYVRLPFCLGPRMLHEGQNRVPGSISNLGYITAIVPG